MTTDGDMVAKMVAGLIAGGDAAIAGVTAMCEQLAAKGVFDRTDVNTVFTAMLEATPQEDERIAEVLERNRARLFEMIEGDISAPPQDRRH